MAYCDELPFGVLSLYRYLNIETMNIISSDTEINVNKRIINQFNKRIIYYSKRNTFISYF